MKTLVIQLARFGDIYLTWPTLIKMSKQLDQEVHLLVRETFKSATIGLPENIIVHTLPSVSMMSAILSHESGEDQAMDIFDGLLDQLYSQKFDQILNLSFSPFSSYLTRSFEELGAQVKGYTRHSDGFLNFHDDTSAYFYAQVGPGRANQFHLSDIMAMMADLDLADEDRHISVWPKAQSSVQQTLNSISSEFIVFHVGASDLGKALSSYQIRQIILELLQETSYSIVLIGSSKESQLAQESKPRVGSERIFDLTGKTQLPDLFSVIQQAQCLLGVDSAPIHMASLVDTPTLNFSCRHVNSFETGPKSSKFKVMRTKELSEIDPLLISDLVLGLCESTVHAEVECTDEERLIGEMIRSVYLGTPYVRTIFKSTGFVLTQCLDLLPSVAKAYETPQDPKSRELMSIFDDLMKSYADSDVLMKVIVNWFDAERIRIPPGTISAIQEKTLGVLDNLQYVLMDWARQLGESVQFLDQSEDWSVQLDHVVKHFRFYNLEEGMEELQSFLSTNSHLFSNGILSSEASSLQKKIEGALKDSDYSRAADLLEYDLRTLLSTKDMIA